MAITKIEQENIFFKGIDYVIKCKGKVDKNERRGHILYFYVDKDGEYLYSIKNSNNVCMMISRCFLDKKILKPNTYYISLKHNKKEIILQEIDEEIFYPDVDKLFDSVNCYKKSIEYWRNESSVDGCISKAVYNIFQNGILIKVKILIDVLSLHNIAEIFIDGPESPIYIKENDIESIIMPMRIK